MSANQGGTTPTQFTPQGPHAYSSGSLTAGQASGDQHTDSSGPGRPPRNAVAIVATVVAVIGFTFAVWEGAYILGWVLLPIAFVLSLVALFQRDRPKKLAVAALIVTIVGTVAGVMAFVASVAGALDDTFNDETTVVSTPGTAANTTDDGTSDNDTADNSTAAAGTRENPHPLGTTVASDDWEVTVNSFTPDATDAVLAENTFNEPPADGTVYALINVTITYQGADSAYASDVTVNYVTTGGEVVDGLEAFVVGPDAIGLDELYAGGSVTGNVVRQIPAGDTGTIRVTPGWFTDDAFFAQR